MIRAASSGAAGFRLGGIMEHGPKAKIISSAGLTSECWQIQFRGLPYCRECEFLATEECGGYRIRGKMLKGEYPVDGLPGRYGRL